MGGNSGNTVDSELGRAKRVHAGWDQREWEKQGNFLIQILKISTKGQ